jgi:hypothetical protein
MEKLTGASAFGAWTEPGTVKVYVRINPESDVIPATSGLPVILSVAEAIPGPPVSSTFAVTVTFAEGNDHAVGATTSLMRGPCSSHTAFTQASAGAQMCPQAYSHRLLLLQKAPASWPPSGNLTQSESTAHFPRSGSPE